MTLSLRKASVLVIDDFQGMRTMLRDFVRSMGVTTIDTASNGRDAILQLNNNRYDIVICDYNLGPGPNGQQVLEEARLKNLIGVATVWAMVTAEKTPEMVMGAAEVRPDDYLLKPINQGVLETRLSRLIARKHALAPIEASVKALNFSEAVAQCDLQLKAKVAYPHEIQRVKSELLLTMGDYGGASSLFESILVTRDVPWAQTGMGKIHFHARQYSQAKDIFQQVLREHTVYMEASDWLARACTRLGETQEAEQVLLEAVKISPNSPMRQKMLGETAYRNGSLGVAQTAFEKTIKIGEFSPHKAPSAYTGLAHVLADRDAPYEALKTLALSKQEFKYNTEAAIQTAAAESAVYHQMGQSDRAEAVMQEAQKMLEKASGRVSAEATMAIARTLFQLGQKDQACLLLQDVVRNNHENAEVSDRMETLFKDLGMQAEGQALIAQSSGEVVAINNQGVTLAKGGDLLGGANLLRTASTKLPHNEVILVNLAGLLIGMLSKGSKDQRIASEARDLLDRVRQINLSNKNYHVYMVALNRIMRGR
jgi:DNA-binding NarL/FixJ family response regulator/TolA-binding protein